MNLLGTNTHSLSVIQDPFNKNFITDIMIRMATWSNEPHWQGSVEFKNGNTKGIQKTSECSTFDEVMIKIKQILASVDKP